MPGRAQTRSDFAELVERSTKSSNVLKTLELELKDVLGAEVVDVEGIPARTEVLRAEIEVFRPLSRGVLEGLSGQPKLRAEQQELDEQLLIRIEGLIQDAFRVVEDYQPPVETGRETRAPEQLTTEVKPAEDATTAPERGLTETPVLEAAAANLGNPAEKTQTDEMYTLPPPLKMRENVKRVVTDDDHVDDRDHERKATPQDVGAGLGMATVDPTVGTATTRTVEPSLKEFFSKLDDLTFLMAGQRAQMEDAAREKLNSERALDRRISKLEQAMLKLSQAEKSAVNARTTATEPAISLMRAEPPVTGGAGATQSETIPERRSDQHLSMPAAESTRLSEFGFPRSRSSINAPEVSNTTMNSSILNVIEGLSSVITTNAESQRTLKINMDLPRHELFVFSGDPTQYQRFRDAFDYAVDTKDTEPGRKLMILLHYLSSNVRAVLSRCESRKDKNAAYKDALGILAERYGDPFLVAQSWTNRLLAFPPSKTAHDLEQLAAELENCSAALNELGLSERMNDTLNMHLVLTKIPMYVQIQWRKLFHDSLINKSVRVAQFDDLVKLVSRAAKEQNYPMYSADCIQRLVPVAAQYVQSYHQQQQGKPLRAIRGSFVTAEHAEIHQMDQMQMQLVPVERPYYNDDDDIRMMNANTGLDVCECHNLQNRRAPDTRGRQAPPRAPGGKAGGGCPCCEGKHYLAHCGVFISMTPAERLRFVKQQGLCLTCFSKGHKAADCPSRGYCRENDCGARHNTSLHFAFVAPIANVSTVAGEAVTSPRMSPEAERDLAGMMAMQQQTPREKPEKPPALVLVTPACSTSTFLPVTPVMVRGVKGWILAHALLDQGSSSSFCTKSLIERLGVETLGPQQMEIHTLSDTMQLKGEAVQLSMTSVGGTEILVAEHVLAIDVLPISADYIVTNEQLEPYEHLRQLRFPTVKQSQIDMLIGQNNAALIKPLDRMDGELEKDPYGVRAKLGWTIHGIFSSGLHAELPLQSSSPGNPCMMIVDEPANDNDDIGKKLDRLWEIEHADHMVPMSAEDKRVIKLWDEKFYIADGHMHLPIPFKDEKPNMPNNYALAEKRLHQVSKKLTRDPVLREKYVKGMTDYIESGYAEPVPDMSAGEPGMVNYSCHHPVERDDKPDVCRIVYDFSALFLGICLNLLVFAGPNLTGNLIDITLRFRQYGVFIMGDIKAMFNRVRVPPEHRDAMRFLWWKDHIIGGEIVCYRMLTHAFGGVWSPSACNYALQKLVQLYGHLYDAITCDAILRSFYVDDCLRSIMESSVGIRLIQQLRSMLWRIGFELTKFSSNDADVIASIPADHVAKGFKTYHLDESQAAKGKALGTGFEARSDMLIVRVVRVDKPLTKRGMLSLLSSVFDPLGLLAPFIMLARAMFQQLCGPKKIDWDDVLPTAIMGSWQTWIEDLEIVQKFSIPRCITYGHTGEFELHLHSFSDASNLAYGAVVYAVVVSPDRITSLMLISKARLAPLKTTTIPRLELCGAVQSVKLMRVVRRALDIKPRSCHYWVDSMIVLCSIKAESRVFKTFVGNRVAAIQTDTSPEQWHYVPTESNPADLPSRGCRAQELLDSKLWLTGPEFLVGSKDDWPATPLQEKAFDATERRTERQITVLTSMTKSMEWETPSVLLRMIRDANTWYRLARSVAWFRRFLKFLAGMKTPRGFVTPRELVAAKEAVVRLAQRSITVEQRNSLAFRRLFPYEEDRLFRVGGRLKNARADIDYNLRHPLLLPTKHDLTSLVIRSVHEEFGHAGAERTLSEVRREFWILSSRKAVRQVLASCTICKRLRSKPLEQLMSDLPPERVKPGQPPFYYCGVDFAGPFPIKIGRRREHRYICVITCFNTRAIHVEVSPGLDTTSFLNAFHRFTSRRGNPHKVTSDNGTNFVGGYRELTEAVSAWNLKMVNDFMSQRSIEWSFNTPYASHHGGVWERMVRSFRTIFLGLMREHVMTDDALHTLACLVESIINSRPLTKLSMDVEDDTPLTPNDLLTLNSGSVTGPPGLFNRYDLLTDRWKKNQFLADDFWRRWMTYYLPTLQKRTKWYERVRSLRPGDLVMLKDESTAVRLNWPLGLVTAVFPDDAGQVRSVEVRTKKGVYRRPIAKLFLLEGDD